MRNLLSRWCGVLAVGVCVLVVAGAVRLHAQAGGALSGKVLDPDARVVVNAAIIIRNEASGEIRTTTTDATGHFSATGLTPGLYTIEVAVPGFEIVRRNGVRT